MAVACREAAPRREDARVEVAITFLAELR